MLSLFACCNPENEPKSISNEATNKAVQTDIQNNYTIDEELTDCDGSNVKSKTEDGTINASSVIVEKKIDPNDLALIEERLIREDEKLLFTFSKNSLVNLVNSFFALEGFETLYDQLDLNLEYKKDGTQLNSEIGLGKGRYKCEKTNFKANITVENMVDFIYNPEVRTKWDTSVKLMQKLEGDNEAYVIRNWMNSPGFLISEREVIDKRFEFFYDGVYYNISASVNEDVINIFVNSI